MNINTKEWLDLLSRMTENLNESVIILDTSYEILYSNQEASLVFYIDELSLTLDQIFSKETVNYLTDFIGPSVFSLSKNKVDSFEIITNTGIKNLFNVIIDPIKIGDEIVILLIFNAAQLQKDNKDENLFSINTISSKEILENKTIKSLVDGIKNNLPITVVNLKILNSLLNSFEFPVWLKDKDFKFLAVNKAFANMLNVDASFALGKKHETFLPDHLAKIFRAVDEFQVKSISTIELKLFGEKNDNKTVISKFIQIPVKDNRSKLYLTIGLIYEEVSVENSKILGDTGLSELIFNYPKPAALINFNNIFEQANTEFCKFLGKEISELSSKSFDEFFPYLISENIKNFMRKGGLNDEFYIDEKFEIVERVNSKAIVSLTKIEKESSKIFIVIDDSEKNYQAENELQNILLNRGKMFEVLIQNNPDPIFIYEKENLKFLEVNEAAVRFYGYSRDEFLQMDLTDLYSPEDIQTLLESFGEGTSEGKYSKPFRHRKKDGSSVIVEISKTSFRFKDKEAHFNIVKDITAEIEKDKQNEMLKIVFNSTDSLIFSTDASGFITNVNYPVIEKLGYTSNDLIQSSFTSLVIDEDRGIVNTTIFQPNLRDEVTLSTKIKKQDGELLDVNITASPIMDFKDELEAFAIVVKPESYVVTKEIPKEIVREVVKEVVVEKPVDNSSSQQSLDASFFSGMFHEILTPMNVIIGFAQELLSGFENPTDEQREVAEIINQNRIKLMDTMNAVIDYSEISQNKFKLEYDEVSITEIVDKLDKNINEISGINEIYFSYGKISSSLKFKTDKKKFENLIFLLIKVISRISRDKKVYFSAYPIDGDNFVIGLNDQYNSSSDEVVNIFDLIFNEGKDPKDFGLPKLSTYLAKVLLELLGGKYQKTIYGLNKKESGFIFSSHISADIKDEFLTTKTDVLESEEQEIIQQTESAEEPVKDFSNFAEDSQTPSVISEQEEDIFKPVNTISEELLSKIEEETASQQIQEQQPETNSELVEEEVPVTDQISETRPDETVENITEQLQDSVFESEKEQSFIPPLPKLNLADLSCLYIEDQVDSQILFKVQMKGLKDVKFAVSFEESQSLLLKYQFDFIVIDINLQGEYNGLDALKIIRTMPALSNVPIIAVTAYVLPGDKEKFIAAGFDDFISKPIFREKMMESLEKIFLSKY